MIACLFCAKAFAGGPKYVAGVSFFNPAVQGQPVVWAGGQVSYFVDQGPLGPLSNPQATAMVDAAAAIWSAVPTAAVNLVDQGSLAEDVNGSNVIAGNGVFQGPADVTPQAIGTPVAVIYDSDGSVIDALEGSGASEPDNCVLNSLLVWTDTFNANATFGHAVIVLNGRCATTANLQLMMSYQLERAFGRILGLDFSQVNLGALSQTATEPNAVLAWPVMQPLGGECGPAGGACIPNPTQLRMDDIAALNRLYPVTSANQSSFPGKLLTAANTVSIQGAVLFRNGMGMQGVNVVARPLDTNGNPLYQYTVTAVTGVLFAGNRGNPVSGWTDSSGNRLDRFGSDDAALQGSFDLSGIPLPPGVSSASYQITFEPISSLFTGNISVGPYILDSPIPSGTLPALLVANLAAGALRQVVVPVSNSAGGATNRSSDTENDPFPVPPSGMWVSRFGHPAAGDWLLLPVRGNRQLTIVAQALDETGKPNAAKALPAIGVWDGFAATQTAPSGFTPAQNGFAPGETWLQVATAATEIVRIGIADQRGDGRPDYVYRGWVLYADSAYPPRLPAGGGALVIRGIGFRQGDTVKVGGVNAPVVSLYSNEITVTVPAAPLNSLGIPVTGSMDIEVDDQSLYYASALIPSGVSYDAGTGDAIGIVTSPFGAVPLNVPQTFLVKAVGSDGAPAAGITVTFALKGGTAALGCDQTACAVTTAGDGIASMSVTPTSTNLATVAASLADGFAVQTQFTGIAPAALTALTPTLYVAAGAVVAWPVQVLAQNANGPASGVSVSWLSAPGISASSQPVSTASNGIATTTLTVGPLAEGQSSSTTACATLGVCATFTVFGARPEFAGLLPLSGVDQDIAISSSPSPVLLRVLDMNGHPMAGAAVTVFQVLRGFEGPCARHVPCEPGEILTKQSATGTSGLDGSVMIVPATVSGTASVNHGLVLTGNSASLSFQIEQHP